MSQVLHIPLHVLVAQLQLPLLHQMQQDPPPLSPHVLLPVRLSTANGSATHDEVRDNGTVNMFMPF
jgi:hypothetical protein